jgi:beta-fructofuranosidase
MAAVWLAAGANAETPAEAISRGSAAIQAAAPRAQSDPTRPIFHVVSPAQWMNDPNGPIFHKGFYHLFYQLHPFSDGDGPKYWGHVRSRDLVKWEPLPIALCPSSDLGEQGVWSGCCTVNGRGQPMIFYTSVAVGKSPQTHAEQWAATSDDELVTWVKSPGNPILSEDLHQGTRIYDWRDPFIFHDHRRTFMVLGGNLNQARGGEAVVNIYEAENPELTRWKYRGVLFRIPDSGAKTAECPNFFKVGNQWVLLVSPYGKVQYFMGDFNATTCRFTPSAHGQLDFGPNFYAPNTLQLNNGDRIVWGWVTGFPGGRGWNGCLTVPRSLSLSRDGKLRQSPVQQLSKLRGALTQWRNVDLGEDARTFVLPRTGSFEIGLELDFQNTAGLTIELQGESGNAATISFDGQKLKFANAEAPLFPGTQNQLRLTLFVDRSVLEVFANDTACATKVIKPLGSNATLQIRAEGGQAKAMKVRTWPMDTIW